MRGKNVMLDRDLAELYQTQTKRVNEQVNRNLERFPESFMFQLADEETEHLRSHFATANISTKSRTNPRVFTEHGILMLANVIKTPIAVQISIRIIEVFVEVQEMLLAHKDILLKLEKIEKKIGTHDVNIRQLYQIVKELIQQESEPLTPIGFKIKSQQDENTDRDS